MPRKKRVKGDSSGSQNPPGSGRKKSPASKPNTRTKYRDTWPEIVIREMAAGKSRNEVAKILGTTSTTLRKAGKEHPELHAALEIGTEWSQAWWEAKGREALNDRTFQWAGWIMMMRNRFNYRGSDPVDHKHSGKVKHTGEIKVSFDKAAAGV